MHPVAQNRNGGREGIVDKNRMMAKYGKIWLTTSYILVMVVKTLSLNQFSI